jgi:hypothetical protein
MLCDQHTPVSIAKSDANHSPLDKPGDRGRRQALIGAE